MSEPTARVLSHLEVRAIKKLEEAEALVAEAKGLLGSAAADDRFMAGTMTSDWLAERRRRLTAMVNDLMDLAAGARSVRYQLSEGAK